MLSHPPRALILFREAYAHAKSRAAVCGRQSLCRCVESLVQPTCGAAATRAAIAAMAPRSLNCMRRSMRCSDPQWKDEELNIRMERRDCVLILFVISSKLLCATIFIYRVTDQDACAQGVK